MNELEEGMFVHRGGLTGYLTWILQRSERDSATPAPRTVPVSPYKIFESATPSFSDL